MSQWLTVIFLLVGGGFAFIAALGVVTMPDLFTRMQASTKSATLGVACTIMAVAFYFGNLGVTLRAILVVGFIFMTAPIAAHMIGRAAYSSRVPLWKDSVIDELAGNFDPVTHTSTSPERFRRAK